MRVYGRECVGERECVRECVGVCERECMGECECVGESASVCEVASVWESVWESGRASVWESERASVCERVCVG